MQTITKAQKADLQEIFEIYESAKVELARQQIFQWYDTYPNISIIETDINNEVLYILKKGNTIVGAINVNEAQDEAYKEIDWEFDAKKVLVIHRLVIHPKFQRNGYAAQLMDFAESFAQQNQYTSVRLDTYCENKISIKFYTKRDYFIRGKVYFDGRVYPFCCMEKAILLR